MKNLLAFLLLSLFSINCFAQEVEELHEMPWANITEMFMDPVGTFKWESDIKVKLEGNYLIEDSLIVANAIEFLDSITENISISFSKRNRGNLEIFFMDSINANYEGYFLSYFTLKDKSINREASSHGFSNNKGKTYSRIYIKKDEIDPEHYTNILKNRIAAVLVDRSLAYRNGIQIAQDRNSIFNPIHDITNGVVAHRQPLNKLDVAIISEVYKPNFINQFETARKQYSPVIPWWIKFDPYQFLILPSGILLIVFAFVFIRLFRWIDKKLRIDILNFNLKVVFVLILLGLLSNTYLFLADHWNRLYPFDHNYFHAYYHNLKAIYLIFAIVLLPGVNIIKYLEKTVYGKPKSKYWKLLIVFVSTSLVPYLIMLIFVLVLNRINNQTLDKEGILALTVIFAIFFIVAIIRVLISYFIEKEKDLILENETKLSNLRELKTKAELNVLHSRINPHFLYNSLNSIAGLAHSDANKTEHMALSLSKLFRYSINKEKSDWTSFKDELEMVRIYLEVEKVRFDERLNYSVEITPELEEQKIPRFIIQPLVENAVKHGISKSVDGGDIKVSISKEGKSTVIAVSDSGQAFPEDLIPGFGIQSIYDKLEILYNDKFEMNFSNSPVKQVTLKLKK